MKTYRWKGPVFAITAINGEGCRELVYRIQEWLDAHPPAPPHPAGAAAAAPGGPQPAPGS